MAKYIKNSYKIYFMIVVFSTLLGNQIYNNCSVCLKTLEKGYLIDAWGNKYHKKHEIEGYYCESCSRLISEALTHGGFKTPSNRYICSLCYPNLIHTKKGIEESKIRVISQLNHIGFKNLPYDIPIILLSLSPLIFIYGSFVPHCLKLFSLS